MDPQTVGRKIADLRKAKGYTQKELAARLHVTDGAVSKWERGINFPDLSIMESLAQILGVSVITLLSLETATAQDVLTTVSDISIQEKQALIKDLKKITIRDIVYEVMILAALLCASKIFDDHQIYGLAQTVTLGMMGFVGTLIGSEFYKLRHLSKLI